MVQSVITPRSAIANVNPKTGAVELSREGFRFLDNLNQDLTNIGSALIIDSVTNGIHDQAPSSNAVFDNLALKLNITTATATYLTIASASATYLAITDAAATYLTITTAAATYLPTATAATTYLPLAGGVLTGTIRLPNYIVSGLPAAATAGAGALAFVTDASTTLVLGLGTAITGGGANKVPAYSDGTSWLYG